MDTNAWVTDRTFVGLGRRPTRENNLHLLDYNSTGQYTLRYELLPAEDNEPPTSTVSELADKSRPSFLVRWTGQDNPGGSGIVSFDVFFSENGGPFVRWLQATPATSALFQGTLGKSYAFYTVAVDRAGNRESPPAAPQAQTTVVLENQAPVFAPQTNTVIVEGTTLAMTVTATDPDGDTVIYELGAGASPGLVLNPATGQLNWATAGPQGPSTNQITIAARDTGIPPLSATQSFDVIVLEQNLAPTIEPVPDLTVAEQVLLTFTNAASDVDLPAQKLTFTPGQRAPSGASVNPTTGLFTSRPNEFQGGTNYLISVIVTDDGSPALSATNSFTVTVLDTRPDFLIQMGTTAVPTNGAGLLPISLQSGAPFNQINLALRVSGDRLADLYLTNLAAQVGPAALVPMGSNEYGVQFTSRAGPNVHSAVAVVEGVSLAGVRTDGITAKGRAGTGRVIIVSTEPILDVKLTNSQIALTLYALPGAPYTIEKNNSIDTTGGWLPDNTVTPTDLQTDLPLRPMTQPIGFFRARTGGAPTLLSIRLDGNKVVLDWPMSCANCVLLQSPNVGPNAPWTPSTAQPHVVNDRYQVVLPLDNQRLFLRLQPPP
ncbi:MAG: hypothetical protein QHJ82_12620 [Verrucomicrobiota bacterium]|nr:hypothetical protein [Verrucomicrobiota bacterium]